MAYFDEKTGEILLSQEDRDTFKECAQALSGNNKEPTWADKIISWLTEELYEK